VHDSPSLSVSPSGAALDTVLRIRATGCAPGAIVSLATWQLDASGRRWSALAKFVADELGVVDTTSDAPLTGTYEGIDPMALVWSMTREDRAPAGMRLPLLGPAELHVTAQAGAGTVVESSVERARLPAGLTRTPINVPGVVGVLFHPGSGGPHPGVILLGGSEGGLLEIDAAQLAGHGFSVLALAYFGMDGVPATLVDLPLESFGDAVDLLLAHPDVRGPKVGILGGSRGGEAALLAGSMFPRVGAVVSTVGSGLMTGGIPHAPELLDILRAAVGSWTWRGRRLPYMPYTVDRDLIDQIESGGPVDLARAFRPDLASRHDIAVATIPVERIGGPVLLLSADDDRSWPSAHLSEIAAQSLARHRHPYPFVHIRYADAGHRIAPPPYGPAESVMPGPGVTFLMGGTSAATSAARADAWQRTVEWFTEHLPG
jgi:dienelactone hydrolase